MGRSYTLNPAPDGQRQGPAIDYRAELNDQQYAAVTAPPGPALVIAGAGSGKTRTLTYRVAYLLDNGIAAENILLLTFTNKAAREMLLRVEELVPYDTHRLWSGTFHSIGNRLLRLHPERVGLGRNFSILDREDQKDLLKAAVDDASIDTRGLRFPKPEVLADIFSMVVNTGVELDELLATRYSYFDQLLEPIAKVHEAYRRRKLDANCVDFDDLLELPLQLLRENPEIARHFQHQFQFILVDEYQDTNRIQSDLIDTLGHHHGNIMVVGDDAQSIYSWRGADFENILKFPERYPRAQVFKIETNYRSVPEILDLANASIARNERQFTKNLQPALPARQQRPALIALDTPSVQANFVAQRLQELWEQDGVPLEEMAVLYRAHFHSMELQMELTRRGLPFRITSGLRFFEQAHIKDVAAVMRFIANRRDEVSFKRITKLFDGLGPASADSLWLQWLKQPAARAAELPESFSDIMLPFKTPKKARAQWDQFAYTLDELTEGGGPAPPATMINVILEAFYDEVLQATYKNYEPRRQDLEQLARFSEDYESIDDLLAQLALLSSADTQGAPPGGSSDPEDGMVTLSTVHQAKGLEWRAVFVISLAEGMFPNGRVIDEGDPGSMEEERRLFYVAVTRAKEELYLTYPKLWFHARAGEVMQRPGRFLEELPRGLSEEWSIHTPF